MILWNHKPELIHFCSQQTVCFICTSWRLFASFAPQTHTHSKISHVHRVDHKHRVGLGPSEKSHPEFSIVLTAALLWHDKQTPHTLQTGTRSAWRKRAAGEATDNIFTEERQGAETVSIGYVPLFVHCVLCSALLKGAAGVLAFSSGGPIRRSETTWICFIASFLWYFWKITPKFLSSDFGLEASPVRKWLPDILAQLSSLPLCLV